MVLNKTSNKRYHTHTNTCLTCSIAFLICNKKVKINLEKFLRLLLWLLVRFIVRLLVYLVKYLMCFLCSGLRGFLYDILYGCLYVFCMVACVFACIDLVIVCVINCVAAYMSIFHTLSTMATNIRNLSVHLSKVNVCLFKLKLRLRIELNNSKLYYKQARVQHVPSLTPCRRYQWRLCLVHTPLNAEPTVR